MKKNVFLIGLMLMIFSLIINNNTFAQTKNSDQKHASCIFSDSVSIKNAKIEPIDPRPLYQCGYFLKGWIINKSFCDVKVISITVNFYTVLDTTLSFTIDSLTLVLPPRMGKFISLSMSYQILRPDIVESFSVYVSEGTVEINGKNYIVKKSE